MQSCDDEVLKLAMSDDNTVSFVFGLEVNWSLLQTREETNRDRNLLRKENGKAALEELNEKRRAEKEKKNGLTATSPSNEGEPDPIKTSTK